MKHFTLMLNKCQKIVYCKALLWPIFKVNITFVLNFNIGYQPMHQGLCVVSVFLLLRVCGGFRSTGNYTDVD